MAHKYHHGFHGDDILKFVSILSTLSKNSSFSFRLAQLQMKAYQAWRRGKKWNESLDTILDKGNPTMEDPQERLFVETVNTPKGSFRIFSAYFLTHKYNLSRLLHISGKLGIFTENLRVVYALLKISDNIVERCGYERYVLGVPEAEKPYVPPLKEYLTIQDSTSFRKEELDALLSEYSLTIDAINSLFLDASKRQLEQDCRYSGFSDTFETHPFLSLHNGKILVLSPPNLLRTAYRLCYGTLLDTLGGDALYDYSETEMIKEVGWVLEQNNAKYLDQFKCLGVTFLWLRFDSDKIANVAIVLNDRKPNLSTAISESESHMKDKYKESKIFSFLVTQQLAEDDIPLFMDKPYTHLTIEELKIVLSDERMNLLGLYYYDEDKKKVNLAPVTQEMDAFAYYKERGYTFYMDDTPTIIYVEIGIALDLRKDYLCGEDEHVVEYKPLGNDIMVRRFHDVPIGSPIYVPYQSPKNIYMLQLKKHEIWIHYDENDIYHSFLHQFVLSLFNWLYAIEYKNGITPVVRNIYIELSSTLEGKTHGNLINEDILLFTVSEAMLNDDETSLELRLLKAFLQSLVDNRLIPECFNISLIDQMFADNSGRFLLLSNVKNVNIIDVNDGVTDCHYVNKRYCDVILDEIADFLNIKGQEIKLGFADSRKVMIKVSEYILAEVQKILARADSEFLLRSLLELNHAMIYWSRLTLKRYDTLQKAYEYIGLSFAHQQENANDYSEMNSLTQGLIECIVLNGIHNVGGKLSIEDLDRLFALMHFNLNMGVYLDQLSEQVKGSELVILKNGRLAMPRQLIERFNSYFYMLRNKMMEQPKLYQQFLSLMPEFEINYSDKKFLNSFVAEYGVSFEKYCKMLTVSINYSNDKKQPIMKMLEKDFYEIIGAGVLDTEEIARFKRSFVLSESLQKEGLKFSDKWLQRFNRRVQITARPWILYNGNIYYSTKALYESWMIKTERINNGTIVSKSPEMKSFIAEINNKKGECFTRNLVAYFKSLNKPDLYVDAEVAIRPGKLLDASKNLGDIDILLIDKVYKKVVCIEAKNFSECRTTYELIQQNKKIVTKELSHVEDRDEWCKENLLKFKQYVSEVDETYSVRTVFLTYHENAYKYFDHDRDNDILFLSAIDLVENPMCVLMN